MDGYYEVIKWLPEPLGRALLSLPRGRACQVQEIRLRSGRPVTLVEGLHSYPYPVEREYIVSHKELQECVYALSDYSLHSVEETLKEGYFTLPGGHRVGVAGEVVSSGGRITGYRCFTSLNIRVARPHIMELDRRIQEAAAEVKGGILLAGPPGSGKTTVLRGVAKLLSDTGKKLVVIDSRGELFPAAPDGYRVEPPVLCDVMAGYPKEKGIEIALRTLGPQCILCDEIGSAAEAEAIRSGVNAGVRFIATIHAASARELMLRPQYQRLKECGAFSCLLILQGPESPGTLKEVIHADTF